MIKYQNINLLVTFIVGIIEYNKCEIVFKDYPRNKMIFSKDHHFEESTSIISNSYLCGKFCWSFKCPWKRIPALFQGFMDLNEPAFWLESSDWIVKYCILICEKINSFSIAWIEFLVQVSLFVNQLKLYTVNPIKKKSLNPIKKKSRFKLSSREPSIKDKFKHLSFCIYLFAW